MSRSALGILLLCVTITFAAVAALRDGVSAGSHVGPEPAAREPLPETAVAAINGAYHVMGEGFVGGDPHAGLVTGEGTPGDVERAAGPLGRSIEELYSERQGLSGKAVRVRGRVVKVVTGVLDTNFVHLADGSGAQTDGSNDLSVTMRTPPAVGETLTVEGVLILDYDLGGGYRYPVLLREARRIDEPASAAPDG